MDHLPDKEQLRAAERDEGIFDALWASFAPLDAAA